MFDGHGSLTLDNSHLDLSFRNENDWPRYTPGGSIRSYVFGIGDAEAGPDVQLGLITPMDEEPLDWQHGIDPVHHHGSDQFRVLVQGNWSLAAKPLTAGTYAFQESGWVYQEHPIGKGPAWMVLLMGDRRGTAATLKFQRDQTSVYSGSDQYTVATSNTTYRHPAGPKGTAAIATSRGCCQAGYLLGSIDELSATAPVISVIGLLGEPSVGPIVHILNAVPGATVLPACTHATELFIIVVAGSCQLGASQYATGDMRIQRASALLPPLVSGPNGLKAVLFVADRRSRPQFEGDGEIPAWLQQAVELVPTVAPLPGGTGSDRLRLE